MIGPVRIVGLGPAGLDRTSAEIRALLLDEAVPVVGRTQHHPAARHLDEVRPVVWCDDLYEASATFDDVYLAIAERVVDLAASGPVTYAVPGSVFIGERAVATIRQRVATSGIECELLGGESFLDLTLEKAGIDPFDRGVQIIDAHQLPDPLLLHLPTLIVQIDGPEAFIRVHERLSRLLEPETPITVLTDLGSITESLLVMGLGELRPDHAGLRVTLALDVEAPGWPGLVQTNARLRQECPWDKEQTHHSLARHLLEEAYETLDAIDGVPAAAPGGDLDVDAYVHLEEELGDLLLQVVFHATLASETDLFGIEEVAESVRRKLVRRHPHVFGDAAAETAQNVLDNWEKLKKDEKGRDSVLDGIPSALPSLERAFQFQVRAATTGFDWPDLDGVVAKVREELAEVLDALDDPEAVRAELGDLLFSAVNLARHLSVDPELALRAASERFERRFRAVEGPGLDGVSLEEMDRRWEEAKEEEAPG
jgi:tetrapyrrole methylase family protein / MazG family protein